MHTTELATEPTPTPCFSRDTERRLEAWLSLPDGDRAELLDGRIVYKAMAGIEHGDVVLAIGEQLGRFRGPPGAGGGWWLSSDVDLYLDGQGLRPDVVGWRIDRHPEPPRKVNVGDRHLGVYVATPDWVCEILSDSTRSRDESAGLKWQAYHAAGVEHYWLVDLVHRQLTVYRWSPEDFEPVEVAGREAVKPLPPFESVDFATGRLFLMPSAARR